MKTIIIDENTLNDIHYDFICESLYPATEQILLVKDYLDKNFRRTHSADVSSDGYPIENNTVDMINSRKESIKTMNGDELLLLLDDKFNNMIKDKSDRRKFLKQVINDWYSGKISKYGILTKNYIK